VTNSAPAAIRTGARSARRGACHTDPRLRDLSHIRQRSVANHLKVTASGLRQVPGGNNRTPVRTRVDVGELAPVRVRQHQAPDTPAPQGLVEEGLQSAVQAAARWTSPVWAKCSRRHPRAGWGELYPTVERSASAEGVGCSWLPARSLGSAWDPVERVAVSLRRDDADAPG